MSAQRPLIPGQSELTDEQHAAALDAESRLYSGDRNFVPRLINGGLTALITGYWLGMWALAWYALYVVIEVWVQPWYAKTFVEPHLATDKQRAVDAGAINLLFNSIYFLFPWAGAWAAGGESAGFIAGLCYMAILTHATVYYAASPRSFFACVVPGFICVMVMPFFVGSNIWLTMIFIAAAGQATLQAMSARNDRNEMLKDVWRIQSEMKAERDASLAKSQFLATMSHELRTPLNAVIGYAEILEEELTEEGRQESANDAGKIRRSARDLLVLINEVLDFSKIEAGRMELAKGETDVAAILREAVELTSQIAAANGSKISLEIGPGAETITTDPSRLKQCVLNLISNACKFTENGTIDVRAAIEETGGERLLRIDVIDTGCGIAEADAVRLFQPFVQADSSLTRKKGGSGLGLVITQRLAELLGGDVTFESVVGQGSTFTLRVLAHQSRAVEQDDQRPVVLVVEDEASARDLFRRAIGRLPFALDEAHSAAEGISRAHANPPALIVLDIHLPDRSGWELLGEFKADQSLRDVPVLVVSIDDDRARALRLGACEHLVKPVDRERLAAAVLRFARERAPEAPAIRTSVEDAA
jgi:signal transduction histidine kinase/CheY-like chemotaxis protein